MPFQLSSLPYSIDALEPFIDKNTMYIHYNKHHLSYVNNLNEALKGTYAENFSIKEICGSISKYPSVVRNNAGGHYNHSLFWSILNAPKGGIPDSEMMNALNLSFGDFDQFKEKFTQAAASVFGSGWAWLIVAEGKLEITSSPNQDNPLMDIAEKKGIPILAIDVWEHAYYLKYQNKRAAYIEAFWNVINWIEVGRHYAEIKQKTISPS